MNNYSKIDEVLNTYIQTMKNINYATEKDIILGSLGDLKSIAQNFNKKSSIQVKSIVASEGSIIAWGVLSSYLISTCNELGREDILATYKTELGNIFGRYTKEKKFIDNSKINAELSQKGHVKLEYPEAITNMFLNTASVLTCRILLGKYITDIPEALNHIEEYLVNNYLKLQDISETRQIAV